MLRDRVKGALCGIIAAAVLDGCADVRPLLGGGDRSGHLKYANIKVSGDPYYEYRIRGVIEANIPAYSINLDAYRIRIELGENKSSVVYTEDRIAKEQLKIAAKITICDQNYGIVATKNVDAYSTFEVRDDLPYADLASKKHTTDAVLDDLAHSIVFAIVAGIKEGAREKVS